MENSYLDGRTFTVSVDGSSCEITSLSFGVPQGSVLGPVLFTIYTIPLSDIMRHHKVPYQLYADDNQLVKSFKSGHPVQGPSTVANLEQCISHIKVWLHKNKLALNAPKTDFINFSSSRRVGSTPHVNVDGVTVKSSASVRDLGVCFDVNMTMKKHVQGLCRSANFSLYKIGRIRKSLDTASTERLIHAFVSSKLDINNGLLIGLPDKTIAPLQRVQNSAARLLCGVKKRDHITPTLRKLHWLPVKGRIDFKIALTCYKTQNGLAPSYLSALLRQESKSRLTRSSGSKRLAVPRPKTKYGDQSFSVAAPKLWNSLPEDIRSIDSLAKFKSALKTFLFNKYM